LAPGRYVALDTESNNPNRWPHTEFTVGPSPAPAALPRPKATVAAIDFNFKTPSRLRIGQLTRFENDGFVVHMVVGIGVKNAALGCS
jgi:hypothetical protein